MPTSTPRPAGNLDAVEVRDSPIHGRGVFALRRLKRGTVVARYEGRRYSPRQAAARDWDHRVSYVFGLSDGSLIDAAEGGNATRHINHACEPNCVAYEVEDERGRTQVEIEVLHPIARGGELFLDYRMEVDTFDPADFTCCCGSAACRGTMLAPAG